MRAKGSRLLATVWGVLKEQAARPKDVVELAGYGLVAAGVSMVNLAAGVIALGLVLIFLAQSDAE